MSVLRVAIVILYTAQLVAAYSVGSDEDSWTEAPDVEPLGQPDLGANSETVVPPDSRRAQWLQAKMNEVRAHCKTPLAPIGEFSIQKVYKQVVDGMEYHAAVTVDGVRKKVSFVRLLPNEQHAHHFVKNHGAGDMADLFSLKAIKPHPCGTDTAELTDETFETDAELAAKYKTGLVVPDHLEYADSTVSAEEVASLPTNFDWRQKIKQDYGQDAAAATVLNQGGCGSCWAFGAATAAGYRSIIESKGQFNVVPSTQIGMSCAKPSPANPCGGGWFSNFYNTMNGEGIPANWAVPYKQKGGQCKVSHDSIGVKGGTAGGVRGTEAMQVELYKNGPFGMAIDAGQSCFQRYKSGVADCAGPNINHAVVAIGWGTENGKPYWLLQNSWGAGWGANGFIKVGRGTGALSVEKYGAQPNYMSEEKMECKDKKPCQNGGAFRANCQCKCADGYSGPQCASCNKNCRGSQFTGSASVIGGQCLCACKGGFVTPTNLLGYGDCALKMNVGGAGSTVTKVAKGGAVTVQFAVVGSAPSNKIQNVKHGDMLVAVPQGQVPWTAKGGWTTSIKADVCGPKAWPNNGPKVCGSASPKLSFSKDGVFDIFFVKYLGRSEFGTDKGYGSDFMKLPQRVCVGSANCGAMPVTSSPTPAPRPVTRSPTPAPRPVTRSPTPPRPTPAPNGACTDKGGSHCPMLAGKYDCDRTNIRYNGVTEKLADFCKKSCKKCSSSSGGGGGGEEKKSDCKDDSCGSYANKCSYAQKNRRRFWGNQAWSKCKKTCNFCTELVELGSVDLNEW